MINRITCILGLTFCLGSMPAYAALPVETSAQASASGFTSVLADVMPTVVNVTVVGETEVSERVFDKMRKNHDEPDMDSNDSGDQGANPNTPSQDDMDNNPNPSARIKRFEDMGSGVIVKVDGDKGYIVTNAHVIQNARLITVTLKDGRRFKAKTIGADRLSDIAVLQITGKGLKVLPFGDSDALQVGDTVAAIGNPFGLHETVTSGMVSALHRSGLGIEGYENFIQTDASINPGNSGGALVDMKGNLVGINTALIGPIGGNVGIGLSIPSNMVKQVVDQLIQHGKVDRGVLGIFVQDVTPALADALGISGKKGALVTNVAPGSPADKVGLKVQDVVTDANGVAVTTGAQLRNMMGLLPAGTKVKLRVLRKDQTMEFNTNVVSPSTLQKAAGSVAAPFLEGVRLTSYDEWISDLGDIKGVGVLSVDEISDAWIGGLRAGDVILAANGEPVNNLDELMHRVKGDSKRLLLKVGREGGIIFLVIDKL